MVCASNGRATNLWVCGLCKQNFPFVSPDDTITTKILALIQRKLLKSNSNLAMFNLYQSLNKGKELDKKEDTIGHDRFYQERASRWPGESRKLQSRGVELIRNFFHFTSIISRQNMINIHIRCQKTTSYVRINLFSKTTLSWTSNFFMIARKSHHNIKNF